MVSKIESVFHVLCWLQNCVFYFEPSSKTNKSWNFQKIKIMRRHCDVLGHFHPVTWNILWKNFNWSLNSICSERGTYIKQRLRKLCRFSNWPPETLIFDEVIIFCSSMMYYFTAKFDDARTLILEVHRADKFTPPPDQRTW